MKSIGLFILIAIGCIGGMVLCPPLVLFFSALMLYALVGLVSQIFHTCDRRGGFLCIVKRSLLLHDAGWIVPSFSLQRLFLMTLEWIEDAIASPFRSIEYFYNHWFYPKKEDFNSTINRRGAYGSLAGAVLSGIGVVLFCALVFNPYTAVGLLGLVTAIITTVVIGAVVAKIGEFLGRLSGAIRTKQLADQQITEYERQTALERRTECTIEFVKELPDKKALQQRFAETKEIPNYFLVEGEKEGTYVPHLVTDEGNNYSTSVVPQLTNPHPPRSQDHNNYADLNQAQATKMECLIEDIREDNPDLKGPIGITKQQADTLLLYQHLPKKQEAGENKTEAVEDKTAPLPSGFKTLSPSKIMQHTFMGVFTPKLGVEKKAVGSTIIESSALKNNWGDLSVPSSSEETSYSLETTKGKDKFVSSMWQNTSKHAAYNPELKKKIAGPIKEATVFNDDIMNLIADYHSDEQTVAVPQYYGYEL